MLFDLSIEIKNAHTYIGKFSLDFFSIVNPFALFFIEITAQ